MDWKELGKNSLQIEEQFQSSQLKSSQELLAIYEIIQKRFHEFIERKNNFHNRIHRYLSHSELKPSTLLNMTRDRNRSLSKVGEGEDGNNNQSESSTLTSFEEEFEDDEKTTENIGGKESEGTGGKDEIDFEGNNEKLRFNIGGIHYDIKRSTLLNYSKNSIGWNLFSCLFQKRWDFYLLKDKKRRIYFDYEFESFIPILQCFKGFSLPPHSHGHHTRTSSFSSSTTTTTTTTITIAESQVEGITQIIKDLECESIMKIQKPILPLDRFPLLCEEENKEKASDFSTIQLNFRKFLTEVYNGDLSFMEMEKIFSYPEEKNLEEKYNEPMKLLILIKANGGKVFAVYTDQDIRVPNAINGNQTFISSLHEGKLIRVVPYRTISKNLPISSHQNGGEQQQHFIFPLIFSSEHVTLSTKNSWTGSSLYLAPLPDSKIYKILKNNSSPFSSIYSHSRESSNSFIVEKMEFYQVKNVIVGSPYLSLIRSPQRHRSLSFSTIPSKIGSLDGKTVSSTIQSHVQALYNELNKANQIDHQITILQKSLTIQEELFLKEILFMEKFCFSSWVGIIPSLNSPPSPIENSLESTETQILNALIRLEMLAKQIHDFRQTIAKDEIFNKFSSAVDPIAYFNVEGEKLCILKSTIQQIIPESQLAVRVSGNWIEQENNLDEEGYTDIDIPKDIFKPIISAIRLTKLTGKKHPIRVKKEKEAELRGALDYFQIRSLDIQWL